MTPERGSWVVKNKMKHALTLLTLLLLPSLTLALNDIGLTIVNSDTPLCLSSNDDLTVQVCNQTQYLILDGSVDHVGKVYFTYQEPQEANATIYEQGLYASTHFLSFTVALLPLILFAIIIFGGVYLAVRLLGL